MNSTCELIFIKKSCSLYHNAANNLIYIVWIMQSSIHADVDAGSCLTLL